MVRRWSATSGLTALLFVLALAACGRQVTTPAAPASDGPVLDGEAAGAELFFSEIIEGSGNNKALEIYNPTGAPVDLAASGYAVRMYFNGNSSAGLTIVLAGTVAAGDVFVLANSGASIPAILVQADQTDGAGWYNGDDAIVLAKDGAIVDAFGQVGFDPGSAWGSGDTVSANHTLRRKAAVCTGDPDATDVFDPATEWDGFAQDTVDGLGTHTLACGMGGAPTGVINEFVASHSGADAYEYVEIKGLPNTDLSRLTVLELEGDGTAGAGTIDGAWMVGTTDGAGYWTTGFLTNELENGSLTLLLVRDFSGTRGDDLDADDDGVLDVAPWSAVVDSVTVNDGDAGDRGYSATVLGPDYDGLSSFPPGGASRLPDGADTDTAADWTRNDFDLAGIPTFDGTPQLGEALNTPGAPNEAYVPDPLGVCGGPATFVHDVQGRGLSSPVEGDTVVLEGVVVGDFQQGDGVGAGDGIDNDLAGFYVQEEDADADGDASTSEGIFAYLPGPPGAPGVPDVAVGDVVRVRGTVTEFNGLTELSPVVGVLVCGTSLLPGATELPLPAPSGGAWEALEGMRVVITGPIAIAEYYNFDRFGETVLALPNPASPGPSGPSAADQDRPFQPTSYAAPGAAAQAVAAALPLRRITLDDGRTVQNPDPARHPAGGVFDLNHRFRGGDTLSAVEGVLDYSFGLYRIQPTAAATYVAANPRPLTPPSVGGDVRVASLNVLNYFTTLGSRGAATAQEFARQESKIVAALAGLDADVVGLIEIENDTTTLRTLVAALNDVMGAGTYQAIDTGVIGTDEIKVALIYRPATVRPVGISAVLDGSVDPRFIDTKNRPALAHSFARTADGATVTVVVNHFKSKGSDCNDLGDPDTGDGQGNCALTRTQAAAALADWLATDPTGVDDPDVLVIGDLNSYDHEDPIDTLLAGNDDTAATTDDLTDLARALRSEFAYSYVFDGQLGYLDYAVASASLTPQVSGMAYWHINADEPDLLDYTMTFKAAAQDALYEPNAFRSSDHDPALVGLTLDRAPDCSSARPSIDTLWPPNHKLVPVRLLGVADPEGQAITITIDGVRQDEPLDLPGDEDGHTSPDAFGVGSPTAQVRAERIDGGNGRVIRIAFTAVDTAQQRCRGEVVVSVPSSQGKHGTAVEDAPLYDATQE